MGQNPLFSKYGVMTPRWKSFGVGIKNFQKIFENFHIGPILGPKGAQYGPKWVKIHFSPNMGSRPLDGIRLGWRLRILKKFSNIFISGPIFGPKTCPIWPKIDFFQNIRWWPLVGKVLGWRLLILWKEVWNFSYWAHMANKFDETGIFQNIA